MTTRAFGSDNMPLSNRTSSGHLPPGISNCPTTPIFSDLEVTVDGPLKVRDHVLRINFAVRHSTNFVSCVSYEGRSQSWHLSQLGWNTATACFQN